GGDSSLCVVLLKNPFNFRNHFLLGYVPQHRTLKLQDTRQDREQHHETSTQTRMTERHHGKKMAPVAPPTIERRRQLIVTATKVVLYVLRIVVVSGRGGTNIFDEHSLSLPSLNPFLSTRSILVESTKENRKNKWRSFEIWHSCRE
ncbi:hypothetical protein AVEN_166215-1, partial [Araneus ventricosus]